MIIDTKRVLVEELTYSGSAFGVLANGEGVFINSRIVDKMELSRWHCSSRAGFA